MTLHNAIGLNLSGVLECASLGMRVMKLAFMDGSIHLLDLDSSMTCQTSNLIKSQKLWKKLEVNPSRPCAFPSFNYCIAFSTSCKVIALRTNWLCSLVMIFGIDLIILSMASVRSVWVSWWTCLKYARIFCSMVVWTSTLSPSLFCIWVMVLIILLCIIELWKNFVFFSPSFSHLTRDFCFQRTSSCLSLSKIWDSRCVSCYESCSVLPFVMIFYCICFITLFR